MVSRRTYITSFSFFSTVRRRRHDVFLSFRGEDTRHHITDQLHTALEEAGIRTFKDDINLEKGGEIATELLKAIQMSRIAVIVFSRNYADSGWCLDELVKIIECKNEDGQVGLPVFYDVDPCDVQMQRNSFARALGQHEERVRVENLEENKVEMWKEALTEASSAEHGWDMHNAAYWHHSKFIKEIVKHVLGRRQDAHMSASIFPPRIEVAKEYLNLLLSVISDDVLVIGIWGMDKTTIAKAVYNQNFERFEASSFISDVSIISEKQDGLLALQKQFLSDILMEDSLEIDNVKTGIDMIKSTLRTKRVLAVLDNVNRLEELNALARQREWFGSGSRIIITTRDHQLLNILEVDDVYGTRGIQIIEDQFRHNLEMINDLKEYIQNYHVQANEREKFMMVEIEREKKKNAYQAQVIVDLQMSLTQSTPQNVLTSTEEELDNQMISQLCLGGSGDHRAI
ncbi:TMV resistance protein N [Quillaja saponaria]|uniref:TMV resistance protein N n=1 Tax=Quillaja saponaria TaxID=32244 RepID=A0AAD7LP80_QUISA|nr:TMV resistance protein N [Quillaja saponaria]